MQKNIETTEIHESSRLEKKSPCLGLFSIHFGIELQYLFKAQLNYKRI